MPQIRALSDARLDKVRARVQSAIRAEVPTYRAITDAALEDDFSSVALRVTRLYFRAVLENNTPSGADIQYLAEIGRRRVHQGIPMDAILNSNRVSLRVLWESLVAEAPLREQGELAIRTLAFADTLNSTIVQAYMRESEQLQKSKEEAQRLFLTRLLAGDYSSEDSIAREGKMLGYNLDRTHVVVLITPRAQRIHGASRGDVELARTRAILSIQLRGSPAVLMRAGLAVAMRLDSPEVAGEIVKTALAGELQAGNLTVGIGTPRPGGLGLVASYQEAQKAQALGAILNANTPIARYDELRIFDLFKEGEPLSAFVREVLGPILKSSPKRRAEAIETVEALYSEGLNRKRAAARLGIHPNTLAYRLQRLEEQLQGSVDSGEFAFRLQLAVRLLPLAGEGRRPG